MRAFKRLHRMTVAVVVAALMAGLSAFAASPASAVGLGVSWPNLVNPVPFAKTPDISDGTVFAITQVGNLIIAGGSFTTAADHGSTATVTRSHILAFDATTGALSTTFAPSLDGTVDALMPGPTANTVYVGGAFNNVGTTKSKGITLLDTTTGAIVSGFKPPYVNGIVYALSMAGSRLYLAGSFTTAGGIAHGGLATLNPTTGKLDPFMNVQFAGHHNYNGTGANGAVGPRAMSINPAGTRAVVIGNFKTADGLARDQIAIVDLDTTPNATVDPNWSTNQYTAQCFSSSFDSYVTDVQYSADGSYFVVTATGGSGTNTDGTKSLCDSAARWESGASGSGLMPTWVDYTGQDSLWSVAVTGTAVYVGGHERWMNNSNGTDYAGAGAVPRPGLAALDPASGVPMNWNPGRNPRGAGTYALYASSTGLYIGSDTDWIGNFKYKHQKIAYFPLAGGASPADTTAAALPGNLYLAGPLPSSNDLDFRSVNGSTIGALTTVPNTGLSWGSLRGVFMIGGYIYFGQSGNLYRASFDGSTVGTPVLLDAYDDAYWDPISTGSGGRTPTYQGVHPTYLTSELNSVTGAFYAAGRIYYTLSGKTTLYSRLFSADTGIIGSQEFALNNVLPNNVAGMTLSGSTLYYADSTGKLYSRPFAPATSPYSNGTVGSATVVDTANAWNARGLFIYNPPAPNQPPVARITTASCTGVTCSFDGGQSSDPDGTVVAYSWDFGDGSPLGSGPTPTHKYAAPGGNFTVTLTVTDNQGATGTTTASVSPIETVAQINFVGQSSADSTAAVSTAAVAAPSGLSPGDTELLYASVGTSGAAVTAPNGWTQVTKFANGPLETTVFKHIFATGDPAQITVSTSAATVIDLQALGYTGVADAAPVANASGDVSTNTHKTPTAAVADAGSWAVWYWADRTSAGQETWSLPSDVTQRGLDAPAKGGGRADSAVADQPTSASTYGAKIATVSASATAGRGNMVTLILDPATSP